MSSACTYVLSIIKHIYVDVLCDNIGLVCQPSGTTDVAASPSQYMIQLSGIPIPSSVLFMFLNLISFFSFIQAVRIYTHIPNYYPKPALLSLLHTYCSSTMRFVY